MSRGHTLIRLTSLLMGLQVEAYYERSGQGDPMLTWHLASMCLIKVADTMVRACNGAARETRVH